MGTGTHPIDLSVVDRIAREICAIHAEGIEISMVIGGGNIFRGFSEAAAGMERVHADHIGMLATVMNALAMQNAIERQGINARVLSAIPMANVCEPYIRRRGMRHLEKGRVVIFAAGTGNPFFTTDTAAALRASEMNCDVLLKGTSVDGIYTDDPNENPSAEHLPQVSYMDVLARDLKVMDASAISLARENNIPIIVFSILRAGGLQNALQLAWEGTSSCMVPYTVVSHNNGEA